MTRSRRTAPSTPNAAGHDREGSVPDIMAGIDRTEGDDGEEMIEPDAGSRRPATTARQSPATRSSPSQTPENQRKPAQKRVTSRVWDTEVGHNALSKVDLTSSKEKKNSQPSWVTTVGHKRWPRGLSLRGGTFQFRVRVPYFLGL